MITGVSNGSVGVGGEVKARALVKQGIQGTQKDQRTKEENYQEDRVELSQKSKEAYANYAILSSTLEVE